VSELFTTVTIHQRDEKSINQFYKVFDLDPLNNKKEEDIKDVSEIKNQNSMSGSLSPSAGMKKRLESCSNSFEKNRLKLVVYSKTHGKLVLKNLDKKLYKICSAYRSAYAYSSNVTDVDKPNYKPDTIMNMYRVISLEQIDGWAWTQYEEEFNKWLPIVEVSIIRGKKITDSTNHKLFKRIVYWRKGYYAEAESRSRKVRKTLSPKHLGILYEIQFFQMYPKIESNFWNQNQKAQMI
jgi:hypothetical protein